MNNYAATVHERFAKLPPVEPPRKESTCILIPMFDSRIEYGAVRGLMESAHLYSGIVDLPCCSDISYARNRLLHHFLQLPMEWAVLLDADILFSGEDMTRLLSGNDYAVNGLYAKKDHTGEIVSQGLGFTRIHRCLLEALIQLPELCVPFKRYNEQLHGFCFSGPTGSNDIYVGEDQAFWLLLSQLGVTPRLERNLSLRHVGRMEYRLPPADFLIS